MRMPLDITMEQQRSVWRQIAREALPVFSIVCLLLLAMVPLRLPSGWSPGGLWPLLGLFYWILVQPRLMKLPRVFIIGLLCDLALGLPLGCYTLSFIVVHTVLTTQRRFLVGQGFWLVWPAFALSVFIVYSLSFLLYDLVHAARLSSAIWQQGLPSVVIVCLALPVLLPLFHSMQRLLERLS
jgi:rod shape-determining protein MreD